MNTTSMAGYTLMARSISTASVIDAVSAQVGGEVVDRPLDDLGGGQALELDAQLGQLGVGEVVGRARALVEGLVTCGRVGHVAHSDSPISAT